MQHKSSERLSVDHDSLAADRQIRRLPPDLAIRLEHFVKY
jgi:hypothetical protein